MTEHDDYPLPEGSNFPLITRLDDPDILFLPATNDKGKDCSIAVCSQFGIMARLKRIDDENYYGLRIRVKDMDKQPRDMDVNRSDLVNGGGREVKARLMDLGLRVFNGDEKQVIDALKAAHPDTEILVVSRRGWHWLSDTFFVCPDVRNPEQGGHRFRSIAGSHSDLSRAAIPADRGQLEKGCD